jgi:hypothetical protein
MSYLHVQGDNISKIGGYYYEVAEEHHGHPVYKKTEQVNGRDMFCYFWDGHDNPQYLGWWFGEGVGGDITWAFHPRGKEKPPCMGWHAPFGGAINWTVKLSGCGVGICLQCPEKAPYDCDNDMCQQCCKNSGVYCVRHQSEWQLNQNNLRRKDRAKRRRGGQGNWW